ncbi:DOT1-domain-containing protein [Dothidotthia symphoricarpi CBS 119687]|uniref:Histone-lysine N-methyltransferase, H3 lysine-79 specific n=1 Tax=Dothidotthia symphoricarpi CBS 119687 TaxID=1392245 RepID=A0A6A6A633_9PLEO|nr:DOT1-domain-containing protein [Dothidotthia symphoricarpi CBS 119687]KAF2126377.1 DOT1-domain-containing protein [Dothidotthia symphoricarpi CBS 119687]
MTPTMFSKNPPKIRTKTVIVKREVRPVTSRSNSATSAPPGNRYRLTAAPPTQPQVREPARQTLSVSRVQQRKRKASPSTPQWASSDESSDDADDTDLLGVKRQKTRLNSSSMEPMTLNRTLEPDPNRRIRIQDSDTDGDKSEKSKKGRLIQGLDMSRDEGAKDFKPAFSGHDKPPVVELQYPSPSRPEPFEAVDPLDSREGYAPLEDIYFSIEEIIQHYLPSDLSSFLSSDAEGTVRLLKRAVAKNSIPDFLAELSAFNKLIRENTADGTIPRILDTMHALPLSLVKRITAQTYNRIVSPHAHRLRKVKGKETTYGELLPPFVHKIFHQTALNSSHVFVDLGSGVGNVVLQSALQTGAASHGIEKMPLAASLGARQASELRARARLWNIALGPLALAHGDFLDTPAIDAVLRIADVVLVNNKVFGEALNNALLQKFLDLKEGCRVVSLESFGGGAKQGVRNEQSIAGLFDEERFESGTDSVSWTGDSVEYYIATKVR